MSKTFAELLQAGDTDKLIPYGPANVMLAQKLVIPVMHRVAALECTKDDILIASFPKSGTVWVQAITSMILHSQGSDPIDPNKSDVSEDWPYMEINVPTYNEKLPIETLEMRKPPRTIRSHLSWELLPPSLVRNKTKIIFVHRKVKDVIVSMYEMFKNLEQVASAHAVDSFDAFAQSFMQDNVVHTPYFHTFNSYWEHWNEHNVHNISYENLHEDAPREVRQLARFLDKPLSEAQVQQIAFHTTFDNMSKNKKLNDYGLTVKDAITGEVKFNFMRKGKVSGWNSHISEELSKKIDEWAHKEAEKYKLDINIFL